ncbi:MAG TPA: Crp/Fnr family transcriptional regulator [Kofleriaceae bacterium]|nr:Crp/Fnr family transcriptional regulator [Kofleriaceae bacterium]
MKLVECSACEVGLASGVGRGQFCPFIDRKVPAGTTVFAAGAPADHVWFVRGGTVVLSREPAAGESGPPRAHAIRFAGSFVGLEVLVSPVYADTATAATDVYLCGATRDGIDVWLGARGTPARTALEMTLRASGLDRPRESTRDGSAVTRLARWLLDEGPRGVTMGVPRHVIADLLGMRPETLSRALGELARRGAIEATRTTLTILDESPLAAAAAGAFDTD